MVSPKLKVKKGERKEREVEGLTHKASGRQGRRTKGCDREITFERAYACALRSRVCTL